LFLPLALAGLDGVLACIAAVFADCVAAIAAKRAGSLSRPMLSLHYYHVAVHSRLLKGALADKAHIVRRLSLHPPFLAAAAADLAIIACG
jgi:hypothetical protein